MEKLIENLKKENEILKERCFKLAFGMMCLACDFECIHRLKKKIDLDNLRGDEDG